MTRTRDEPIWIHALNALDFHRGDVFGWAYDDSPTGFLSGVVVEIDHRGQRVLLRDIRPATVPND